MHRDLRDEYEATTGDVAGDTAGVVSRHDEPTPITATARALRERARSCRSKAEQHDRTAPHFAGACRAAARAYEDAANMILRRALA